MLQTSKKLKARLWILLTSKTWLNAPKVARARASTQEFPWFKLCKKLRIQAKLFNRSNLQSASPSDSKRTIMRMQACAPRVWCRLISTMFPLSNLPSWARQQLRWCNQPIWKEFYKTRSVNSEWKNGNIMKCFRIRALCCLRKTHLLDLTWMIIHLKWIANFRASKKQQLTKLHQKLHQKLCQTLFYRCSRPDMIWIPIHLWMKK